MNLNALHEAADWRNHQLAIECADDYLTDNEQTLALYALDLEERVASYRKQVADGTLVPASKYDALVKAAEGVARNLCNLMEDWYCQSHSCDACGSVTDPCIIAPLRAALEEVSSHE